VLAGTEPTAVVPGKAGESILGMPLTAPARASWCVALVRHKGRRWTTSDREALLDLRPYLALVLAHALLQEEVAIARGLEGRIAEERERELAAFSHELRNPLAPILMWASTLKRLRPDDEEVQRATQAITHAVNLERQLIEDVSDVSRLQRGVLALHRETVDLGRIVRDALVCRQRDIDAAELTLESNVPSERVPVAGDAVRLTQVVGNLLGNAIKFTPAGGTIAVTLAREGNTATLVVSDSGPGMPEELAGRFFTPFLQGTNARGGLGVGLAVARWLIELHGGAIEAQAQGERGGATLSIRLPLRTT
jgi:signal transduction histidine kinase